MNLLNLKRSQYYCSIQNYENDYFLAAIAKENQQVSFKGFIFGTLAQLAKKFSHYGLVLAVPEGCLEVHTEFLAKNTSPIDAYQIIKKSRKKTDSLFDVEIMQAEEDTEEKLAISYYLRDNSFISSYCQAGFQLAALEPFQLLKKRQLDKGWQLTALENLPHQHLEVAALNLKLLDRDNFHEIICA
jgi:hypothetical protein